MGLSQTTQCLPRSPAAWLPKAGWQGSVRGLRPCAMSQLPGVLHGGGPPAWRQTSLSPSGAMTSVSKSVHCDGLALPHREHGVRGRGQRENGCRDEEGWERSSREIITWMRRLVCNMKNTDVTVPNNMPAYGWSREVPAQLWRLFARWPWLVMSAL